MSDVLIRDLPEMVLEAIGARAARLGISRSEYMRRLLARDAAAGRLDVTVADLRWFADAFVGIDGPALNDEAWT
jgi:plasmid stability protein